MRPMRILSLAARGGRTAGAGPRAHAGDYRPIIRAALADGSSATLRGPGEVPTPITRRP